MPSQPTDRPRSFLKPLLVDIADWTYGLASGLLLLLVVFEVTSLFTPDRARDGNRFEFVVLCVAVLALGARVRHLERRADANRALHAECSEDFRI